MKKTEESVFIYGKEVELLPGQIGVANEGRFDAAFLSEPLTAYAAGYKDPTNLEEFLDFIAPRVPVARRFEYRKGDAHSAVFAESSDGDIRSIGADFKVIQIAGEIIQAKTANKGLTMRLDRDESENEGEHEERVQRAVAKLKRILLRTELIRAVNLLIVAGGAAIQKNWAQATGNTDPDSDVLAAIDATRASGVVANRVLYTDGAWTKRILGLRAQDNPGGYASSGMTPEQLAGFLAVNGVKPLTGMVFDKSAATKRSGIGKAATTGYAGRVLGFNAQDGLDVDDPSAIKRFVSNYSNGDFSVFIQDKNAKVVDVTVDHHSLIAVTIPDGVFSMEVR